jgi:hypothetical protein
MRRFRMRFPFACRQETLYRVSDEALHIRILSDTRCGRNNEVVSAVLTERR